MPTGVVLPTQGFWIDKVDLHGGSHHGEAPRRGAPRRRSSKRKASSRVFHALVSERLAPVRPVVPSVAANLGGGGTFRGRPRPRLKELDGLSPALAVVDEWRVSFDVCDWRSCGSARQIPVIEAVLASARVDSDGCVSACDVGG
eukprot:243650-Pleurochrysis_carterae.AAC.1